jgi:hypothetical protein
MKHFVSSAQCIYVFPVIISNELFFVIEKQFILYAFLRRSEVSNTTLIIFMLRRLRWKNKVRKQTMVRKTLS